MATRLQLSLLTCLQCDWLVSAVAETGPMHALTFMHELELLETELDFVLRLDFMHLQYL